MEKALTKYFWIVNLATLAAIAYFCASGTSELAAGTLLKSFPQAETGPTVQAKPRRPTTRISAPDGDAILERNIFDSTVSELPELDNIEPEELPVSADGELPLVPCTTGQAKLLATVASSRNPEWSFANVQLGTTKDLYRIGDELEGRTVSGITWRYLLLKGSQDECYIDMFDDPKKKPPRKPTARTTPAAKADDNAIADGIQVDGEYERTVDRSVVDQALANPTKFAKSVRVRPYKKNGKVVGFRLRRVQKGSPLEMLGAQRGDIIHSVNGIELTSVDQALAAYQGLRSDNRLTFSVTRKGKPVELNINIR